MDTVQGPFDALLLKDYWGRRPLLIQQAFSNTQELLEDEIWPLWGDIVQLASHKDADQEFNTGESARLITCSLNDLDSYTLELGPISKMDIESLKNNNNNNTTWTLLVNDVDRFWPPLHDWMEDEFTFLPRWRRDDAQVSIAPSDGGIGPHVDNYDVFLIQATGRRLWRVGHTPLNAAQERHDLISGINVSILAGNYTYSEFVLEAGDVLYLPPRVVHWGTSLSEKCMTISVGCRAPSAAELTARVAETMLDSVSEPIVKRYTDKDLLQRSREEGPSLNKAVKDSMKQLVLDAVQDVLNDALAFDELVGRLVTESKRLPHSALHPWDDVDNDEYFEAWGETLDGLLDRVLNGVGALYRAEGISVATSQVTTKDGSTVDRLYACGEVFEIKDDPLAAAVFERIEQGHALNAKNLSGLTPSVREVLDQLVAEGFLDASDDNEEDR